MSPRCSAHTQGLPAVGVTGPPCYTRWNNSGARVLRCLPGLPRGGGPDAHSGNRLQHAPFIDVSLGFLGSPPQSTGCAGILLGEPNLTRRHSGRGAGHQGPPLTYLQPGDGDVVRLHRGPPGQPRRGLRRAHGRVGQGRVDAAPIRIQQGPLLQRELATGEVGPGLGPGDVEGDLSARGLQGPVPGQAAVHSAGRLALSDHDEGLHAQMDAQGREAPQGFTGFLAFAAITVAAPAPQLILGGGPVATGLARDT